MERNGANILILKQTQTIILAKNFNVDWVEEMRKAAYLIAFEYMLVKYMKML